MPDWAALRSEFPLLDRWIYLNACSLGPLPRSGREALARYARSWDELGTPAWYSDWLPLLERLRARIAQLLSNLLANALTHGAPDAPVRVDAHTDAARLELSVANRGDPIPPATQQRLFQPFSRASLRPGQQGLGLGLYIASEIARAHGGTLEVSSTAEETRFTFRMPLG